MTFLILFIAAVWAGAQNALAGGGALITLPLLILSGMNPRAANITSTIALFPGQVASGWTGWSFAAGAAGLSLRALVVISLLGGAIGAGLMLAALTASGVTMRVAGATKNVLAAVMNASAVLIFLFSPEVKWLTAGGYAAGAILGGIIGGHMVRKVNERVLRLLVVLIGLALTVGLFIRGA